MSLGVPLITQCALAAVARRAAWRSVISPFREYSSRRSRFARVALGATFGIGASSGWSDRATPIRRLRLSHGKVRWGERPHMFVFLLCVLAGATDMEAQPGQHNQRFRSSANPGES